MEPSGSDALLFLERVPQAIWVGDETGDVIYSNAASFALTGYTKEEYWGRSGHELTHYLHRDGTPYPVSECPMLTPRLTGETIHCDEDWFIRPDGTFYPISWWAAPIDLPTGRGVIVSFADITEQLEMEHAARERDAAQLRAELSRAAGRRIVDLDRPVVRRKARRGAGVVEENAGVVFLQDDGVETEVLVVDAIEPDAGAALDDQIIWDHLIRMCQ